MAESGDETMSPANLRTIGKSRAKESLAQLKARKKREMQSRTRRENKLLVDAFAKATAAGTIVKRDTAIVFDEVMKLHDCPWDKNYPENPKRYEAVLERLNNLGLIKRCKRIEAPFASAGQIFAKHSADHFSKLESLCELTDVDLLEQGASDYDAIYFNNDTLKAALKAVGCCIALVKEICAGNVQNGLAVVRPPGHHAMKSEYCGYCYFNNVALAADYALDHNLAERILIVDFDVHHGQATQQMFYRDKRVLYFSIHRYEDGNFWPNLRESHFDYIGDGEGVGYNINVPLNEVGLTDTDYLSIVHHILLPVAYEYQPHLIILSAGYDSCVGCLEGLMDVSPAFYAHLITLLSGLASGKVAVCLEGGYFLPSLAEGVAMSLKSLLGDAPPMLKPLGSPKNSTIDVINNVKFFLHDYWKCFQIMELVTARSNPNVHEVVIKYSGKPDAPPFLTRNCYPIASEEHTTNYTLLIDNLRLEYESLVPNSRVSYAYDEDMLLHFNSSGNHPECPERLKVLYERFLELGLDKRCDHVKTFRESYKFNTIKPTICDTPRLLTVLQDDEDNLIHLMGLQHKNFVFVNNKAKNIDTAFFHINHDWRYINSLTTNTLILSGEKNDVYTNHDTIISVLKSVGCLLGVVDSVLTGACKSGAAMIRPPGHHAEEAQPLGFCFVNNISIAAKYILLLYKIKRILILDFDIHHGNGTQHAFYDNDKVLYISMHKYDHKAFFPSCDDANYNHVGEGAGVGYNVNIPFNDYKMGNSEYLAVFHKIILPIAYAFCPEVILISAGFDAGVHDLLGNYNVTPEAFGHFIQMLKPLAEGRLILALEGGYNVRTVAFSMTTCIKTLLGDPLPSIDNIDGIVSSAVDTIENVIRTHKPYWPILNVNKPLPDRVSSITVLNNDDNADQ